MTEEILVEHQEGRWKNEVEICVHTIDYTFPHAFYKSYLMI